MGFDKDAYEKFLLESCWVGFHDPPVELASGRPGHWYVNIRSPYNNTVLTQLATYIVNFMKDKGIDTNCVVGVPDNAVIFAQAVSKLLDQDREMCYGRLRRTPKTHGTPADRYFIGAPPPPDSRIAMIEDTTTTGRSTIDVLGRLREQLLVPAAVIVLVDREELSYDLKRSAKEVIEQDFGIPFYALTTAETLLPKAYQRLRPAEIVARRLEAYPYSCTPIKIL